MKKSWLLGVAAILVLALIGLIVKSKFFAKSGMAALSVSTNPKATVYVDGNKAGVSSSTSLLIDKIEAKEHAIKLVPEGDGNLPAWETKVNLAPNILTVINRNFAASESASSGEVIWLEKIGNKNKSSLTVVSVPEQAVVRIDNEPKGFSPVSVDDLNPGSYQVVVASPGYEERTISAKTVAGYKLIVNIQLAQKTEGIVQVTPSPEAKVTPGISPKITPKPTSSAIEKPYVVIKETPTGWLRVRMAPSTTATEAAKIKPGETYPYLNEEKNGWYKIEYTTDKEGWISKVYAELVE